jgi:hypothetical protein
LFCCLIWHQPVNGCFRKLAYGIALNGEEKAPASLAVRWPAQLIPVLLLLLPPPLP